MNQILCRRSADKLDRLLLAIKPAVEKRHSTGTDAAEVDRMMQSCQLAQMTIYAKLGIVAEWSN